METGLVLRYIGLSLASYLIGAIPFSYLIAKLASGKDLREHGSGNVGASNTARVVGKVYGGLALLGDVGKGLLAAYLASLFLSPLIGCLAIVGHIWTPFLNFSGGKGVATSLGALSFFSWQGGLIFALIWIGLIALWQVAAISSLVAMASFPISFWLLGIRGYGFWAGLGTFLLIVFTHRENIARLLQGEENKV